MENLFSKYIRHRILIIVVDLTLDFFRIFIRVSYPSSNSVIKQVFFTCLSANKQTLIKKKQHFFLCWNWRSLSHSLLLKVLSKKEKYEKKKIKCLSLIPQFSAKKKITKNFFHSDLVFIFVFLLFLLLFLFFFFSFFVFSLYFLYSAEKSFVFSLGYILFNKIFQR